jgi:hypothetical protein
MKLFGTGNTPFQPADPALNIPDGDPRELTTVTNQSLNNLYGELKLAIEGSGQTLTDVNGTSPNLGQLWKAISSSRYKSVTTGTPGQVTTTGQILTNNLNFTAPCNGFVILNAILNVSKESSGRYTNAVLVDGSVVQSVGENGTTAIQFGIACTKGTSYSFQQKVTVTTGGTAGLALIFSYSFSAGLMA